MEDSSVTRQSIWILTRGVTSLDKDVRSWRPYVDITSNTASGYTIYTPDSASGTSTFGYLISAAKGTFTLSGKAAAFRCTKLLSLSPGSFVLTGRDANLLAGRKTSAAVGSFTLTGNAASLLAGRKLSLDSGVFSLVGRDAALTIGRVIAAQRGAFSLVGLDTQLLSAHKESCDAGTFALAGQSALLLVGRRLSADASSLAVTGQDAALTYTPTSGAYSLTAEPGPFSLSGGDAALIYQSIIPTDQFSHVPGRSRKEEDRQREKIRAAALLRDDEEVFAVIAAFLQMKGGDAWDRSRAA